MRRAFILYGVCAFTFLLGVINADNLLAHFDDINSFISLQGNWGENMLNINTYSDRVKSWMNLKDPATYSLFGLDHPLNNHDFFTQTLVSYGIVGLVVLVGVVTTGVWFVQRTVLRVEDARDRQFAIFCLAVTIPSILVGFINLGNFTANPVNLQIWTFFGGAICMVINSRLAPEPVTRSLHSLKAALQASQPRIPMAARAALTASES